MKLPRRLYAGAGFFLLFASVSGSFAVDFPQGLMLHFNFDQWEGGGVVTDKTGRGNSGRATGAKWTQYGKQSGGYEFTSTNNYIQVTNSPSLFSTQATFAVWFRIPAADAVPRYIMEKNMTNGYALAIAGESDGAGNRGKLCFSASGQSCYSDIAVADGTWHHGTATFDGENLKLFVDGNLQKQTAAWRGVISSNTNDLTIGLNRSNPAPNEKGISFNGMIDELMIFNHGLSEEEVKVVIASTKPKFTKEQVARRVAELKELLDRGLILQEFYDRKVKECEVSP